MKFAVIKTGGKQYRVSEGDRLKVEKLAGDHKEGDKIKFEEVLLFDDGKSVKVGTPYLDKATVEAKFIEAGKGKKIRIQHFKAKSNYSKVTGHRQQYNEVEITKVAA